MMICRIRLNSFFLFCLLISLVSCQRYLVKTWGGESIEIEEGVGLAATDSLVKIYAEDLELEMAEEVAFAMRNLEKAQPESPLGNLICDLIMTSLGDSDFGPVDFSLQNYGGIRVPVLDSGIVTRGEIFEMLPFQNLLVILEMNGTQVHEMFEQVVAKGGWPVSRGVEVTFGGDELVVRIHNKELEPKKIYKMITNDYLANGGDGMSMFKSFPRKETGVLIRDALFSVFESYKNHPSRPANLPHFPLNAEVEGRYIEYDF